MGVRRMKISWKEFKKAFPYYCIICNSLHWEDRIICEACGIPNNILKTTKKVYRQYKRKQKR